MHEEIRLSQMNCSNFKIEKYTVGMRWWSNGGNKLFTTTCHLSRHFNDLSLLFLKTTVSVHANVLTSDLFIYLAISTTSSKYVLTLFTC